ncbi:MAG: FAD-dependent monooxygenase [Armatimonadota bacterium]|nr:FAD-dependent monooxygenase [Armatimonadota bacterium]
MRIAVIGGGPGGLFFAALMRRADPGCRVTVFERNAPEATYGFGVVFPERSLRYLRDADPELHAAFAAAAVQWEEIAYGHRGVALRFGGHVFWGIARTQLLRLLRERAAGLGADLHFQTEAPHLETLDDYDLVVAADGVNSATRTALTDALGASVHTGRSRFIWLGTTKVFDALTFLFAEDAHGWWGAHVYPYSATHSTVIVETDETTWCRAGFGGADEAVSRRAGPRRADDAIAHGAELAGADEAARTAANDELESVRYCQALFAPFLEGAPLLANNSRWLAFRTVRCRRWHAGRVVLLGDAVHTAHFSVGSGTRMAMEDAIALVDALREHATLAGALEAYERERQPAVARIQQAAEPSRWWWEQFRWFVAAPPARFAFHHLSRAPLLSYGALAVRDRRALEEVERGFAAACGRPSALPYAQPLVLESLALRNRIVAVVGAGPGSLAGRAAQAAAAGAGLVLVGPRAPAGAPLEAAPCAWYHVADAVHAAGSRLGVRLAAGEAIHASGDRPATVASLEALAAAGVDMIVLGEGSDAETVRAARVAWPAGRPLAVAISAWVDPHDHREVARGLETARASKAAGCGLFVVGSAPRRARGAAAAGVIGSPAIAQVFTSDLLRHAVGLPTALVGGRRSVGEVNAIVLAGRADLCEWPALAWPGWRPAGTG